MKHNWERDENGNINEWAWEAGFHNGVFCVDCGKSVCVHCNPDYMEFDDCTGPQKQKVITNADRIRSMSDEELAQFIFELYEQPLEDGYLQWLQQPAKEDA